MSVLIPSPILPNRLLRFLVLLLLIGIGTAAVAQTDPPSRVGSNGRNLQGIVGTLPQQSPLLVHLQVPW